MFEDFIDLDIDTLDLALFGQFLSNHSLYGRLEVFGRKVPEVLDVEVVGPIGTHFLVDLLDHQIVVIQGHRLGLSGFVGTLFILELQVSIAQGLPVLVVSNLATEDLSELLESLLQFHQITRFRDIADVDLLVLVLEDTRVFYFPHHSDVVLHNLLTISLSPSFLSIFLLVVGNKPKSPRSTFPFVPHHSH